VVILALMVKTLLAVRAAALVILTKLTDGDWAATHFPMIFALLVIVGVSFLLGLGMISQRGRATGSWIERKVLMHIPGYHAVRIIVGGFANTDRDGVVKPAMLTLREGVECFVFVTEEHDDGRCTIFIPNSPNPASGYVQVVQKTMLRLLNVRISDIASAHQQWGVGTHKALAKHLAAAAPDACIPQPSHT